MPRDSLPCRHHQSAPHLRRPQKTARSSITGIQAEHRSGPQSRRKMPKAAIIFRSTTIRRARLLRNRRNLRPPAATERFVTTATRWVCPTPRVAVVTNLSVAARSEEHTSELQSHLNLVCRLLLEKKKISP